MERRIKTKKAARKRRTTNRDETTVELPEDVTRCAAAFGNCDPRVGLDRMLRTLATVWSAFNDQQAAEDEAVTTDSENDAADNDGLTVSGFGVTALIDLDAATEFIASAAGAVIGDSIRESLKGEADPAAEIEELCALATACVIDRVPEFWLIVAAKITHALYDTYGDALAAILSDVSSRWPGNSHFTIEQRKQLVQQVKDQIERMKDADNTLRKKPFSFSGMRGGVSEATLLDAPTPEQLSAYVRAVERVKPVWTRIIATRNSDPKDWHRDAEELAVKKFDAAEMSAYHKVIARIPSHVQSLNSARIQPAVCAREHARTILGISARGGSLLKKLAATDDQTS